MIIIDHLKLRLVAVKEVAKRIPEEDNIQEVGSNLEVDTILVGTSPGVVGINPEEDISLVDTTRVDIKDEVRLLAIKAFTVVEDIKAN